MDQIVVNESLMGRSAELFRVGPGYIAYWMHVATHHNTIDDRERRAILALGQSLGQLMWHRDAIETARRASIPVSPLDRRTTPTTSVQRALFAATKDFYLSFYSSVSAFAGVVKRFPSVFGEAPQHSNEKFLEWMTSIALFESEWHLLRAARDFRTLLDHPASKQPYEWGTLADEGNYLRTMLHGPAGQTGNIPEGAESVPSEMRLREDDAWIFVAPDEDRVLSLLSVQLNALVSRIQIERFDADALPCDWVPPNGDEDPDEGFPIFATGAGTIIGNGPMTPEVTPADQARIDAILEPYIKKLRKG